MDGEGEGGGGTCEIKFIFFFILYEYIFVWLSSPLYGVGWVYNSRVCTVVCTATVYSFTSLCSTVMFSLSLKVWQEGSSHHQGKYDPPWHPITSCIMYTLLFYAAPLQGFNSSELTKSQDDPIIFLFYSQITGHIIIFFFSPFCQRWKMSVKCYK